MKKFAIFIVAIFFSLNLFAQKKGTATIEGSKKESAIFNWIGLEDHPMRSYLDSCQLMTEKQMLTLALHQKLKNREETLYGEELEREKQKVLLNSNLFSSYRATLSRADNEFARKNVLEDMVKEYESTLLTLYGNFGKEKYYLVTYDAKLLEYSFEKKGFRHTCKPTEFFKKYGITPDVNDDWISLDDFIEISEKRAEGIIQGNPSRKVRVTVILRDSPNMSDNYEKEIIFCAISCKNTDGFDEIINVYPNVDNLSKKIIHYCNNVFSYDLKYDLIDNNSIPVVYNSYDDCSIEFDNLMGENNPKNPSKLESIIHHCKSFNFEKTLNELVNNRLTDYNSKKTNRIKLMKSYFKVGNRISGYQILPSGVKRDFIIQITNNKNGYISGFCSLEKNKKWVTSIAVNDEDSNGASVGFYYQSDDEIGASNTEFILSKDGQLFGYAFFCNTNQMVKTVLKLRK